MTAPDAGSSKREALRSTSIIGGASAITLLVRMVRTKILAVLLGPGGVGLEAIFDSVVALVKTVFEFGINGSGVREIAAAPDDPRRVARAVITVRRAAAILGALGGVALVAGGEWASMAAFGDADHATAFRWLGLSVFFGILASGLGAVLQGMRRIGDLARMNVLGALLGALVSIPVVYVWGRDGIPAYMITAAAFAMLMSWYFSRRVRIEPIHLPLSASGREVRSLFRLGFAFMAMALVGVGAAFLVRALVTRQFGLEGAGQFQAATALSMVYVGFVLQAMGTDFYPRLTAAAEDDARCVRLVNEQAEISLMLALPGVLGTIALAPWVISVFYTGEFAEAADILAWQMVGMLLRVMSWPLGFVTLAKSRGAIFFLTDLAAWSFFVAMAWIGMQTIGLVGTGVAFMVLYVFHVAMMHVVARKLIGFRWERTYLREAALGCTAAAVVLWLRLAWPEPWATIVPCLIAAIAGVFSLSKLVAIVGRERVEAMASRYRLSWLLGLLPQSTWR